MQTFVETGKILPPLVVESIAILDSVRWKVCKDPEMIRNHICNLKERIKANHSNVVELENLKLVSDIPGK